MFCEKHGAQAVFCRFCDADTIQENEYLELDQKLAEFDGWSGISTFYGTPPTEGSDPTKSGKQKLPRYTKDSELAERLCRTMSIKTVAGDMYVQASFNHTETQYEQVSEKVRSHDDKETALRVAIVRAAIRIFEKRLGKTGRLDECTFETVAIY